MRIRNLVFFLLLLLSPVLGFAQTSQKNENEVPKKEILTNPAPIILLPNTPDSWAINLDKKGGILGNYKLLVAINSNGQYVCGSDDKMKTVSITKTSFLELAEMVDKFTENIYSRPINEALTYCNDCIYNSLSFYRNVPDVKTIEANYYFQQNTDVPTMREVFAKVWQVTKCDENPQPKNKKS